MLVVLFCALNTHGQKPATSTESKIWNAVPDSDLVAYVNVRKIVNDAVPRIAGDDAAAKKNLEHGFDELWAYTGLQARQISRAVIGAKFVGKGLDMDIQQMVVIAEGQFNYSDVKAANKLPHRDAREEKYGTYTLFIFHPYEEPTDNKDANAKDKNDKKDQEFAIVPLGPDLIAGGNLDAVKRTVDAFHDEKGRANAELVARARNAPGALVVMIVRVPGNFVRSTWPDGSAGRLGRLLSSIKDVRTTLSLGKQGFPVAVEIRSNSAASAIDLRCVIESIRTLADLILTGESGQAFRKQIDDLKISSEKNRVLVRTELTVATMRSIVAQ
jgi:hypothetical protein